MNARDEEEVRLYDEMAAADSAKYGYPKADIPSRVSKELQKWDKVNQPKLNMQLQEDAEIQQNFNDLMYLRKQELAAPLTERKTNAIWLVAARQLSHEMGKNPTDKQVAERASKLAAENNYYKGE
jgi:hypothetical protein